MAVGFIGACPASRIVGCCAVPSIGVAKCSTRGDDDGHFGFAWRDCGDVVECVGIDFRQRGRNRHEDEYEFVPSLSNERDDRPFINGVWVTR